MPTSTSAISRTVGSNTAYDNTGANDTSLASQSMSTTGGGGAHNNLQPFLTLNFIIALVGLFPSRS